MENIGNALAIASAIGVSETDLFQNAPLYDGHKSYHQGNTIKMSIPVIPTYARPVEAVCNKRESSEEQLRAGKSIVEFWGIHRQTLHFTKLKKSSLKRYLCF